MKQLVFTLFLIFYAVMSYANNSNDMPLAVSRVSVSTCITQFGIQEDGSQMIDSNLYTSWQYAYNAGTIARADFIFDSPVSIDRIIIFNGYGKSYTLFMQNGKIQNIKFTSGSQVKSFSLKTGHYDYEELVLNFKNVKELSLFVTGIKKGSKFNDIALSSIEFIGSGKQKNQKDYSGMIPIIIEDKYQYHEKTECKRNMCFGLRCEQYDNNRIKCSPINETLLFWAGFYDFKTKQIYKLFEGINSIQPIPHKKLYLFIQQYWGWGSGVFHPYRHQIFIFNQAQGSFTFITDKIGGLEFYEKYFRGSTEWGSIYSPENYDKNNVYHSFDYKGKKIHASPITAKSDRLAIELWDLSYNKISGIVQSKQSKARKDNWQYKSGIKHGFFYNLGKGYYALMKDPYNRYYCNKNHDNSCAEIDCCAICDFSSDVLIFNKDGYLQTVAFSKRNKMYPFFIDLHEDPCSASTGSYKQFANFMN